MKEFLDHLSKKNPGETEFLQTVEEFLPSAELVLKRRKDFRDEKILERMVEPERMIIFRVPWMDDQGEIQVNRGFRVQMNSALGPFKGGLRFHPSVNLSILKFLAFEQTSKNALTSLPLGAGKGGADFSPKGKSDREVMRFCQAFMNELFRHIGANIDIPAGDIGVGTREIGYLFGKYKKISNEFSGALTGKGIHWGGSLIRPEATGYGLVYFAQYILNERNQTLENKKCLVSGAGNVAQYCIEKLIELNARVISASDSKGYIHDKEGFTKPKLQKLMEVKNEKRAGLQQYAEEFKDVQYYPHDPKAGPLPMWEIPADCAFPSATQNEILADSAEKLSQNGIQLVAEGSNMACTNEAIRILHDYGIVFAPGKASNAGGVAVSGMEMSQNSLRMGWSRTEVEKRLKSIMKHIHDHCLHYSREYDQGDNYLMGANIAGFTKVGEAMLEQGLV